MFIHSTRTHKIFFGDKRSACIPEHYRNGTESNSATIPDLAALMNSNLLIFAHQVHGTDGLIITEESKNQYKLFQTPADFIITNVPNVALGVVTADCLPMIFYDAVGHAMGIVHAGWSGTIQGIVVKTLNALTKNFGTQPGDVTVYCGPCASVDRYEVSADFADKLTALPYKVKDKVLIQKNNKYYFDLVGCNKLLLEAAGVNPQFFNVTYNHCTLKNDTYCSYRREPLKNLRNVSLGMLL